MNETKVMKNYGSVRQIFVQKSNSRIDIYGFMITKPSFKPQQ